LKKGKEPSGGFSPPFFLIKATLKVQKMITLLPPFYFIDIVYGILKNYLVDFVTLNRLDKL
jgi:hypothetical protein